MMRKRLAGARRAGSLSLLGAMALIASLAALGVPAAMATPKGEFAVFADCPLTNPEISGCVVSKTESGEITIGKTSVPIVSTQTLQGGVINTEAGNKTLVAAKDGNTLSKTPQKVPGGLAGLVKCNEITNFLERIACEVTFENGLTGVNAVTELATGASSVVFNLSHVLAEAGTGLTLPIKVKLENPLLGSECYIGSAAHPITLQLTSGTTAPPAPNKPIKGSAGEITSRGEGAILVDKHNKLVDNSFSAPEATGCGGLFSFLIDPIIDSKLSLPSAAGKNTAILNSTVELAGRGAVEESE